MLRRRTGNDFPAIAEINMAYQINVRQHATDLPLTLRRALGRDELTSSGVADFVRRPGSTARARALRALPLSPVRMMRLSVRAPLR